MPPLTTHPLDASSRNYLTARQAVPVAGVADLVVRSLRDRSQFCDPHGEAERLGISSAAWPLFGLLWPSGAQLASRLGAHPVTAGERILEIGCGLALASLVGHRRGADVTASDCHPLAERFLRANLRLNGLAPMKYRHGHWRGSGVRAPGGDAGSASGAAAARPIVEGRFELIIGSDLLYERDADGALARFIAQHAARDGEVWIVDPDRGNRPAFNRRMAGHGFKLDEQRLDRAATAGVPAYRGRLLRYVQ